MRKGLFIVLFALLSACASLNGLTQKPEVAIVGIDLLQLGFLEQRFALQLRIRNPNDVDLPIDGLSFEIEVNGQSFVSGLSDKRVSVPRFGEALLEVIASSTLAGALKQFHELRKGGRDRVEYRIVGRLNVSGIGSVPFERRGELQMPGSSAPAGKPARGERADLS
ncbi:LEA type 2 family protein [Accumulibacter sp.]|uniref:LEA type 2 family protein n=1 Tax=Accumulibacter sp. TaxID=2053492 RepID=UPI0028C3DD49|nr:LEA type 2 family protein [Accumulibacter sp.]